MKFLGLILVGFWSLSAVAGEWTIDLSRRTEDLKRMEMEALTPKGPVTQVFEKEQPKTELVIANTDKGFVPKTVKLKKGQIYKITVVNVNKNKKNASFMLDAFAEHHGIYFGESVSFTVKPQKEGLFQFYSPEPEYVGKMLVEGSESESLQAVPPIKIRHPASVEESSEVSDVVIRGGNG